MLHDNTGIHKQNAVNHSITEDRPGFFWKQIAGKTNKQQKKRLPLYSKRPQKTYQQNSMCASSLNSDLNKATVMRKLERWAVYRYIGWY